MKIEGGKGIPMQRGPELDAQGRHPQVMDAARMYENHFLREMVKAMRQTVPESEANPMSMAEKIFRGKLDDQYVDDWVQQGGVGFADVIYQQVMDRFFTPPASRPSGPIQPDNPDIKAKPIKVQDNDMTIQIKGASAPSDREVLAPWGGKVIQADALEGGLKSLILDHGGGLKSSLVYRGWIGTTPGSNIEPGQKLGGLSIQNPELLWRIQSKV